MDEYDIKVGNPVMHQTVEFGADDPNRAIYVRLLKLEDSYWSVSIDDNSVSDDATPEMAFAAADVLREAAAKCRELNA